MSCTAGQASIYGNDARDIHFPTGTKQADFGNKSIDEAQAWFLRPVMMTLATYALMDRQNWTNGLRRPHDHHRLPSNLEPFRHVNLQHTMQAVLIYAPLYRRITPAIRSGAR